MYSGLYTAATGMLVQQLRQEVVSQNLANLNTPGYKQRHAVNRTFSDVLLHRLSESKGVVPIGTTNRGVQIDDVPVDWTQGTFEATDSSFDFALQGKGFFTINTPEGSMYTRNGHFQVDEEGFLVSSPGNYIMGDAGPIWVGREEFAVYPDGTVAVQDETIDKLHLVDFTSDKIIPVADGLFKAVPESEEAPSNARVRQGYLEKSNIDPVNQVVRMMEAARAFEANQRVVQVYDQIMSKGANEIGSLR